VARLDISGEKVSQVRFVAVEEACQGKGLGKLVMNEVEKIAISRGDTLLILHAREVALPFYKKQGYQLIEKSHLLFDKIQHFLMQKEF
jgi:GNAT superfamily N-acetyltransferase